MCSCHSILECCVMFSGVKLSIRSFVLFISLRRGYYRITFAFCFGYFSIDVEELSS